MNIYIENNEIGDEGIKYLQEALRANQGKTALNDIDLRIFI